MGEQTKRTAQQFMGSKALFAMRMVATPALDIHSPYHVITRGIMANIAASKQLTPLNTSAVPSHYPAPWAHSHLQQTKPQLSQVPQLVQVHFSPGAQNPLPITVSTFQTLDVSRPFPQDPMQPTAQDIQQDDTSDDATSSTVDLYDTQPTDEVYDARPGDEADLTVHISYEDALKYSPVEVLATTSRMVPLNEDPVDDRVTLNEGTVSQMPPVAPRQIFEEVVVAGETPPVQDTLRGTQEASCCPLQVSEVQENLSLDLDAFNKEIEKVRTLRLGPRDPGVDAEPENANSSADTIMNALEQDESAESEVPQEEEIMETEAEKIQGDGEVSENPGSLSEVEYELTEA
jgi:hypothetical protein